MGSFASRRSSSHSSFFSACSSDVIWTETSPPLMHVRNWERFLVLRMTVLSLASEDLTRYFVTAINLTGCHKSGVSNQENLYVVIH